VPPVAVAARRLPPRRPGAEFKIRIGPLARSLRPFSLDIAVQQAQGSFQNVSAIFALERSSVTAPASLG
ncbi:MAG: hypothetical protein LW833_06230, partial [Hyphomicrobiales bacterium]|nr:hypothetical protein [Hyphomicrobiales bacterium]